MSILHCITQVNINLLGLMTATPCNAPAHPPEFQLYADLRADCLFKIYTFHTQKGKYDSALRGQQKKKKKLPQTISQTCITVLSSTRLRRRTDWFSESGVSEFKEWEQPAFQTPAILTG